MLVKVRGETWTLLVSHKKKINIFHEINRRIPLIKRIKKKIIKYTPLFSQFSKFFLVLVETLPNVPPQ